MHTRRVKPRTYCIAAAITMAASLALTPPAWADPDPHIPDGKAGWCPGGQQTNGLQYCLGEAFPDGTFYAQGRFIIASQPFRGPQWQHSASCMTWINGQLQGAPGCGGVGSVNI